MASPASPYPTYPQFPSYYPMPSSGYSNDALLIKEINDSNKNITENIYGVSKDLSASTLGLRDAIERNGAGLSAAVERNGALGHSTTERIGFEVNSAVDRNGALGTATTERVGANLGIATERVGAIGTSATERVGYQLRSAVERNGSQINLAVERSGAITERIETPSCSEGPRGCFPSRPFCLWHVLPSGRARLFSVQVPEADRRRAGTGHRFCQHLGAYPWPARRHGHRRNCPLSKRRDDEGRQVCAGHRATG